MPAVTEEPAATEAPTISANDEVLCSYLMTLEAGDANNLGVPVPEYCKPYLRSLGRTDVDAVRTDPRTILFNSSDYEEIRKLQQVVIDMWPPGFAEGR
jgi:hypothetical protein